MTLNKCHVSFECFSRAWKEKPINFVVYFVWLEIIEKVSLSRWHCWQAQILITSHQHTYQFTQNLTKRYKYWRIDWKEKEQKRREKRELKKIFANFFNLRHRLEPTIDKSNSTSTITSFTQTHTPPPPPVPFASSSVKQYFCSWLHVMENIFLIYLIKQFPHRSWRIRNNNRLLWLRIFKWAAAWERKRLTGEWTK